MKLWIYFTPVAALVLFAAYLGLRAGYVPTDSEIIERYAKFYLRDTINQDARPTDCAARTHPDDAVRMVVTCGRPGGQAIIYYVGPRGDHVVFDENGVPRA